MAIFCVEEASLLSTVFIIVSPDGLVWCRFFSASQWLAGSSETSACSSDERGRRADGMGAGEASRSSRCDPIRFWQRDCTALHQQNAAEREDPGPAIGSQARSCQFIGLVRSKKYGPFILIIMIYI